jgi:hypothetical protein
MKSMPAGILRYIIFLEFPLLLLLIYCTVWCWGKWGTSSSVANLENLVHCFPWFSDDPFQYCMLWSTILTRRRQRKLRRQSVTSRYVESSVTLYLWAQLSKRCNIFKHLLRKKIVRCWRQWGTQSSKQLLFSWDSDIISKIEKRDFEYDTEGNEASSISFLSLQSTDKMKIEKRDPKKKAKKAKA